MRYARRRSLHALLLNTVYWFHVTWTKIDWAVKIEQFWLHKKEIDQKSLKLLVNSIKHYLNNKSITQINFYLTNDQLNKSLLNNYLILIPGQTGHYALCQAELTTCAATEHSLLQGFTLTRSVGFSDSWFRLSVGLVGRATTGFQARQLSYSSSNFQ